MLLVIVVITATPTGADSFCCDIYHRQLRKRWIARHIWAWSLQRLHAYLLEPAMKSKGARLSLQAELETGHACTLAGAGPSSLPTVFSVLSVGYVCKQARHLGPSAPTLHPDRQRLADLYHLSYTAKSTECAVLNAEYDIGAKLLHTDTL